MAPTSAEFKSRPAKAIDELTKLYLCTTVLSGILCLLLGLYTFCSIESKRLLPFPIDEIGLQINHYFKRKQAIYSPLGFLVLLVALIRTVEFLFLAKRGFTFNDVQDPMSFLMGLDFICVINILVVISLFCLVKFST